MTSAPTAVRSHCSTHSPTLGLLKTCHLDDCEVVNVNSCFLRFLLCTRLSGLTVCQQGWATHTQQLRDHLAPTPLRGVPAHVAPPAPTSIPPREREKADDWKGGVFPRPGCGMRWELVAGAVRNCQLAPQGLELHRAGLLVSRVHL